MPEMNEADVLVEEVSWILDSMSGKIIDLVWSRVYQNEWRIYEEAYSSNPCALAHRRIKTNEAFIHDRLITRERLIAETLYEGLKKHILE